MKLTNRVSSPSSPLVYVFVGLCFSAGLSRESAADDTPVFQMVGVAKVDITPKQPVVLAGYGGRTGPFEGVDSKLWARVLVIGEDHPVVVVAVYNCGVPQSITDKLLNRLEPQGISRAQLVVAATHTHNAPALPGYAKILWAGRLTPEQSVESAAYAKHLLDAMEQAVSTALTEREPMEIGWRQGRVGFGGNRRVLAEGRWQGFGYQENGPVDHSLPILIARDKKKRIRAIWVNYACHCTTVGSRNFVGGDWAGFANEAIEDEISTAIAVTTIGCGADVGPQPSGSLELARQHGRAIAAEVKKQLLEKWQPLNSAPISSLKKISLALNQPPGKEHWQQQLETARGFHRELARSILQDLATTKKVPDQVDYRIQMWHFGDELAMAFLPGEVVVDYAVRLKSELDWNRLWITAWANDVPGYIPSRRVLSEGGYEAEFSQVYYGWPSPYSPEIENQIVSAVKELAGAPFRPSVDGPPSPFHRDLEREALRRERVKLAYENLNGWLESPGKDEIQISQRVKELAGNAFYGGVDVKRIEGGMPTRWNGFSGLECDRIFIRQQTEGAKIRWETETLKRKNQKGPYVFCFSGGVGWRSSPKTGGFALRINDQHPIHFDVTNSARHWVSKDQTVELVYMPTWNSDEDSAGFFLVIVAESVAEPLIKNGQRVSFSVESLGSQSNRWFAIDSSQKSSQLAEKLIGLESLKK